MVKFGDVLKMQQARCALRLNVIWEKVNKRNSRASRLSGWKGGIPFTEMEKMVDEEGQEARGNWEFSCELVRLKLRVEERGLQCPVASA